VRERAREREKERERAREREKERERERTLPSLSLPRALSLSLSLSLSRMSHVCENGYISDPKSISDHDAKYVKKDLYECASTSKETWIHMKHDLLFIYSVTIMQNT